MSYSMRNRANQMGFIVMLGGLVFLFAGCLVHHEVTSPDYERFEKVVSSPALRDSLQHGVITCGMPYFVVSQIFSKVSGERKIPVPSVGSRQRLGEREGLGRVYLDPNIRVFIDVYDTEDGELTVWYRYLDFYRASVAVNDKLFLCGKRSIDSSMVQCLRDQFTLLLKDTLASLAGQDSLYGVIVPEPDNPVPLSYWYPLSLSGKGFRITLKPANFEYYPIEALELKGKPVSSYQWRSTP
jgi:hypothetical protein